MSLVFYDCKARGNEMIVTNIFEDENKTQYLVTVFDNGFARLAIREENARTWSAPIELIRTERTETE
jgi:hypothetical protein